MIRAVIFDLDGTLVNSLADLADSMNEVLAACGHPTHPEDAYRRFVGDGLAQLVERALPAEARQDQVVELLTRRMSEVYAGRQTARTRPYPGVPELLGALAERGLRTAILTNKADGPAREIAAALLEPHVFDRVRGARPGVPLKPDPTAALELASELGTKPSSCVFVGDSEIDIRTGRAAGMPTIGVTWGFRAERDLIASGARRIVRHPVEVLEVLDS
jgi:phosphoglycolate phosphatase